jgi:hypothetical protein
MAGEQGVRRTHPATRASAHPSERPTRDPEGFPIRLIPILVPALAVLLATVVYFLLGEIL